MLLYLYPLTFLRSLVHWVSPLVHRLNFLLNLKIYLVSNLILHPILGNDITIDWIPHITSQEIILDGFQFYHSYPELWAPTLEVTLPYISLHYQSPSSRLCTHMDYFKLPSWQSWPQTLPCTSINSSSYWQVYYSKIKWWSRCITSLLKIFQWLPSLLAETQILRGDIQEPWWFDANPISCPFLPYSLT